MNLRSLLALAITIPFAACGDDDETLPIDAQTVDGAVIDAAIIDAQVIDAIDALVIDAPIDAPSTVQLNPGCVGVPPGDEDLVVSAAAGVYAPANPTITEGDTIRFEPGDPNHDMTADNGEFQTPLGQITCLRFTGAGDFPVHCNIHGFATTIHVSAL